MWHPCGENYRALDEFLRFFRPPAEFAAKVGEIFRKTEPNWETMRPYTFLSAIDRHN